MAEGISKIMRWVQQHFVAASILVVLIVGAIGYVSYFAGTDDTAMPTAPETAVVRRGDLSSVVTGTGQVVSREQVNLRPVVAGDSIAVVRVAVTNNQEVQKGDLIAVLDTAEAAKAVRDATLNLKAAEIKMQQTRRLYPSNTRSDKLNRDIQRIAVKQGEARLADAKEDLLDYYIRAPFAGVVTELAVVAGDSITREEVLASVITKEMIAEITLNEVDAVGVKTGQPALLTFDALGGQEAHGQVSKIDTIGTIEQNVVSYTVELTFEQREETLKPGMSVDVTITTAEKKAVLLVPNAAIKTDERGKYVLLSSADEERTRPNSEASGGPVKRTDREVLAVPPSLPVRVEIGLVGDAETEILSGLSEGAVVIIRVPTTSVNTSSAGNSARMNAGSQSGGSLFLPFGSGRGVR